MSEVPLYNRNDSHLCSPTEAVSEQDLDKDMCTLQGYLAVNKPPPP